MTVRDADPDELADWDARTVEAPGGHVYQSRAWAEHRRASGWRPRFLVTDDGGRVLALTRPWVAVRGGSAYLPRGPVGGLPGADPDRLAARQVAVAERLAGDGIDVVAADPEVLAADGAFRTAIRAAGCRPSIRAITRRAGPTTPASSTSCAGGRSSWPSAKAAWRWISGAWTSPALATNHGRATRCTASTSTSWRSGDDGSC